MPPYSRIAITLPKADLAAADKLARAQDRPRSWIIAEAIRRFVVASAPQRAPSPAGPPAKSAERDPVQPAPGLGESRLAQLTRDLALTPEARVRAAEETLRLTDRIRRPKAQHVIAFDRYLDYIDWQRTRDRLG